MKYSKAFGTAHEVSYLVVCENYSPQDAAREVIMQQLRLTTARRLCKKLGHKWQGTGYGGPDSGGDGAVCTRCGKSWWIQFY